jgi:hypothetical protein
MGNFNSKDLKTNDLSSKSIDEIIDYIATYYILTANFQSLQKLTEKEYCNQLIILTSDILSKYFTDLDIEYLEQRVEKGININKQKIDHLHFFNIKNLSKMETESNPLKKKRMCLGISKFYIKIAHIFSAIVMTINPIYTYKNNEGNTINASLFEKNKIPSNILKKMTKNNICSKRINSLTKNNTFIDASNNIIINPNLCSLNMNLNNNKINSLLEEIGIKELEELYYDEYDFNKSQFTNMKPETRKIYENDVKTFYKTFMNTDIIPDNIKTFKDISINNYHLNKNCQGKNPLFKEKFIGKIDLIGENVFAEYANHINSMIRKTNKNHEALLNIINEIFIYSTPNISNNKILPRINPKIDETMLNKLIETTRKYIIQLYINCEEDYQKGIKIYQKLIEKKILDISKKQIETLNENIQLFYSKYPNEKNNLNIDNPNIDNPNIDNPNIDNPNIDNPNIDNPNIDNPNIDNPNIDNLNIDNPNIDNLNNENIINIDNNDTNIEKLTKNIENDIYKEINQENMIKNVENKEINQENMIKNVENKEINQHLKNDNIFLANDTS